MTRLLEYIITLLFCTDIFVLSVANIDMPPEVCERKGPDTIRSWLSSVQSRNKIYLKFVHNPDGKTEIKTLA